MQATKIDPTCTVDPQLNFAYVPAITHVEVLKSKDKNSCSILEQYDSKGALKWG